MVILLVLIKLQLVADHLDAVVYIVFLVVDLVDVVACVILSVMGWPLVIFYLNDILASY